MQDLRRLLHLRSRGALGGRRRAKWRHSNEDSARSDVPSAPPRITSAPSLHQATDKRETKLQDNKPDEWNMSVGIVGFSGLAHRLDYLITNLD
jgi:hypothetical protein